MWTTNSCFSVVKLLTSVVLCLSYRAALTSAEPVELFGMNYNSRQGADWNPFKCKSRHQVMNDLILMKRMTSRIRVLSLTDCGQGELVLDVAKELGLKLWLGLWVSRSDSIFLQEKAALESMFERNVIDDDTVIGITVSSESIYRGEVDVEEAIDYKNQIRELVTDSGFPDMPVTIVDIAQTFQKSPVLTKAVDVIMINIFPFWSAINLTSAMDYLTEEIGKVTSHPFAQEKELVLGETGWPSDGFIPGVGTAGPELQRDYFIDFYCKIDKGLGWDYYYFTGIDNAWRQEQDQYNTIEGTWGFLYANLTLKPHFEDLTFSCPGSDVEYSFGEIDWTIPTNTAAPTTPAPTGPGHCGLHEECKALNLSGNCCPADNGVYLGCCDQGSAPTITPTTSPTKTPTLSPTTAPPTVTPTTNAPTKTPTNAPTTTPTNAPTKTPTNAPTKTPTASPEIASSPAPTTTVPTANPTAAPTNAPTKEPSPAPTSSPTTTSPMVQPTTNEPTTPAPTEPPTATPSIHPTVSPIQNGGKDDIFNPPPTTVVSPPSSSPSLSPSISSSRDPASSSANNKDEGSGATAILQFGMIQSSLILMITCSLTILNAL